MVKWKAWKKVLLEFCRPIKMQSLSPQTHQPFSAVSTQDADTKGCGILVVPFSLFVTYSTILFFFSSQASFCGLVTMLFCLGREYHNATLSTQALFWRIHLYLQMWVVRWMIFTASVTVTRRKCCPTKYPRNIGWFLPNFNSSKTFQKSQGMYIHSTNTYWVSTMPGIGLRRQTQWWWRPCGSSPEMLAYRLEEEEPDTNWLTHVTVQQTEERALKERNHQSWPRFLDSRGDGSQQVSPREWPSLELRLKGEEELIRQIRGEVNRMFGPGDSKFKSPGMGGEWRIWDTEVQVGEGIQQWKARIDAVAWVKTHYVFLHVSQCLLYSPPPKKKSVLSTTWSLLGPLQLL